jgi:hypothetical protein
MAKRDFTLAIV